MTRFIQLHLLTSYPPANLNRDDSGNPKTARMGGVDRLRVSSQSLKRAWRTSEAFQQSLAGTIGQRTKRLGRDAFKTLREAGVDEKQATEWVLQIVAQYGAVKKDGTPEKGDQFDIEQLVHVAPAECATLNALIATLAQEKRAPTKDELAGLLHKQHAVDIALFGRMLAGKPDANTEAAVQVAHALGVHASAVEDDYFTAVDDLNVNESGAAHVGETGFAAAVFYQYICIDRDRLLQNLDGDEALTSKAIAALTEAALTVAPNGKQNSFASRARAHFALAEKGSQQPRSLSLAFVKPVNGLDYARDAIEALIKLRDNMDLVYERCNDEHAMFNVLDGTGTARQLIDFVATP